MLDPDPHVKQFISCCSVVDHFDPDPDPDPDPASDPVQQHWVVGFDPDVRLMVKYDIRCSGSAIFLYSSLYPYADLNTILVRILLI